MRRIRFLIAIFVVVVGPLVAAVGIGLGANPAGATPGPATGPATYHVTVRSVAPPKLAVTADIPIDGQALAMDIDYTLLASHGWPAPRESGVADGDLLVLAGRSMFITTPAVGSIAVSFSLPRGGYA